MRTNIDARVVATLRLRGLIARCCFRRCNKERTTVSTVSGESRVLSDTKEKHDQTKKFTEKRRKTAYKNWCSV